MNRSARRLSVALAFAGIALGALPSALAGSATWPSLATPPAVSSSAAPAGAKDVALLVAIEQYQDTDLPPVAGARQNLADWKAWLRARGVPTVVTLVDSQALKSDILAKAAAVAAKGQAGGKMWVLFIGHGSPSQQGDDGLLLTYNAVQSASGIEDFSVSRAALLEAVQSGSQSQSIVVLDACFSGRTAAGDLLPGLAPMRSVREAVGGPVTLLTAAHSNEYAGALPDGSRMAFSYLLLGALARGWGDENNDGQVMASEAVSWVDGAFLQMVKGRTQSPVFDGPDLVLGSGREKLDIDAFMDVVPPPRPPGPPSGASSGQDWTSPTVGLMKYIPAGTFTMGSPEGEVGRHADEVQHKVTLTRPFLLMEHELTQGEWQAVMGWNPSHQSKCGASCPVEQVSWDDAQAFIAKLSSLDGVNYRLPTEAEWEYAARGAQSYPYAGSSEILAVAWYDLNSGSTTHPVCQKARNGLGLCDMSGNVWEWVADWFDYYAVGSASDPVGASAGEVRVRRGGSWFDFPGAAHVAYRIASPPDDRRRDLGFRLARSL